MTQDNFTSAHSQELLHVALLLFVFVLLLLLLLFFIEMLALK